MQHMSHMVIEFQLILLAPVFNRDAMRQDGIGAICLGHLRGYTLETGRSLRDPVQAFFFAIFGWWLRLLCGSLVLLRLCALCADQGQCLQLAFIGLGDRGGSPGEIIGRVTVQKPAEVGDE